MSYKRNELSVLLRAGLKQKKIAELLNKTPSAICQELKRNPADNQTGYDSRLAKQRTKERRINANQRFRKIENSEWIRNYIIRKIKRYWSPEQISGRIEKKWPGSRERHIGKDCIYKFIYEQRKDLVKYMRCQKGKYRRRYGTRIREKKGKKYNKGRLVRFFSSLPASSPWHPAGKTENPSMSINFFFLYQKIIPKK